jgi:hypothetical protein
MMIGLFLLVPLALIVLGMGVAGALLVRAGRRGRRVGDHPVCRRCGFDLFGLPEDRKICPECGGDLTTKRAIEIGHRQRRPVMIGIGVTMLLLFGMIVGLGGSAIVREVDWQRVKPVAWLAWEARRGDATAWSELTRRVGAGEVSNERTQALVDDALAWQKDRSRAWKMEVGDFVEKARAARSGPPLVTDEQWATYARQAPQLSLYWRAKVQPGTWLPGNIVIGPSRAGSMSRLSVRIEGPVHSDDPLVRQRPDSGGGSSESTLGGGGGSTSVSPELDPKALAAATPGKRTTEIRVKTQIRENWQTGIVEWTETLSADWELVGKDVPTVEIVPDDSAETRKQIEAALKVNKLEVRSQPTVSGTTSFSLDLVIGTLPVPLAYDVYLRGPDGKEWKMSSISVSGPTHYGTGGYIPAKANFDAKRVDLIFRPAPKVAEGTVDITRMWNGELLIHDVPVTWPATQPSK